MERTKVLIKFLLGLPLSLVAFFFIFKFITDEWGEVSTKLISLNPLALSAGLFFLFLFFLFRSFVWNRILEIEGFSPPLIKSTYLLSVSEIKRYIPGSILGFIARINSFSSLSVPPKKTVRMIFYESIIFVVASVIISVPSIISVWKQRPLFDLGPVFSVIFITGIVIFLVRKRILKKIREYVKMSLKYKGTLALMLTAWIFFGLGNYLVGASLAYLDPKQIISISSSFVFAWLIGYAVLIAPLGLGVREAAVIFLLSNVVTLPIAASIAILTRLAQVAAELIFLLAAFIFNKFVKLPKKINFFEVALWSSIAAYIAYFTFYTFEKYKNFFTGRFDLGNMDQTVWNSLNGRIFMFTNPDGTENISRLAFHADFILVLLAPFYLIWEDPRTLLFIQTVVIALGAYFIYKTAEFLLNNRAVSLSFALSYLLHPFVQKQNLYDFHAVTMSTTLLSAAFYFFLKRQYKLLIPTLILAGICKEQVWAVIGLLCIYFFIKTKQKLWLAGSFASFLAFYLLLAHIIPYFRGEGHFAAEFFSSFGSTPFEIMKNMFLNPVNTVSVFLANNSLSYLYNLFLPAGFLTFLAPHILILAAPDLLINTLSANSNFRSMSFHYGATIIPFIYIGSIYGAKFLENRFKVKTKFIASYILVFTLFATYNYGTLPGGKRPSLEVYSRHLENRETYRSFLAKIPDDYKVAATNNLGSHLSHRDYLYTIPIGIEEADIIVFLLNDSFARPSLSDQEQLVLELKYDPDYVLIYESDRFFAFAKRSFAKSKELN